jgi:hypothetical protein
MLQKFTKWLGQWTGAKRQRREVKCHRADGKPLPRRAALRRLTVEPLEHRRLLDVSLTFSFYVQNLPQATSGAVVPIVNANVCLLFDAKSGLAEGKGSTNYKGTCVINVPDAAIDQGFSVEAFTSDSWAVNGSKPYLPCEYDVYNYARSTTLDFSYFKDGLTVPGHDQTFPVPLDAQENPTCAAGFAIFSALSVPLNFAMSLGATLPPRFVVNYPNGTTAGGGTTSVSYFSRSSESGRLPTINLVSGVLSHIDTIGHEFGHMVAWANGFASDGSDKAHAFNANIRSASGLGTDTSADQEDLGEAFSEGFADYFAVACKESQTSNTLMCRLRNVQRNFRFK